MLELQSHMHSWIYPSIQKYAEEQDNSLLWLCQRVVDLDFNAEDALMEQEYDSLVENLRDEHRDLGYSELITKLQEAALEYASTTNDGSEFYLDGWISVPWCDEDYYMEFYG